jgi:hypothetical protein
MYSALSRCVFEVASEVPVLTAHLNNNSDSENSADDSNKNNILWSEQIP